MNFDRWGIVHFGRAAGALVIIGGIVLSAWLALDQPEGFAREQSAKLFLQQVLSYVSAGGLLVMVSEIAGRMGWGWNEREDAVEDQIDETDAVSLAD